MVLQKMLKDSLHLLFLQLKMLLLWPLQEAGKLRGVTDGTMATVNFSRKPLEHCFTITSNYRFSGCLISTFSVGEKNLWLPELLIQALRVSRNCFLVKRKLFTLPLKLLALLILQLMFLLTSQRLEVVLLRQWPLLCSLP